MKLSKAQELIDKPEGYRVHFYERVQWNDMRESGYNLINPDFFPDPNEEPFKTAEDAYRMAVSFARKMKNKYWDIHICNLDKKRITGFAPLNENK